MSLSLDPMPLPRPWHEGSDGGMRAESPQMDAAPKGRGKAMQSSLLPEVLHMYKGEKRISVSGLHSTSTPEPVFCLLRESRVVFRRRRQLLPSGSMEPPVSLKSSQLSCL